MLGKKKPRGRTQRMTSSEEDLKPSKKEIWKIEIEIPDAGWATDPVSPVASALSACYVRRETRFLLLIAVIMTDLEVQEMGFPLPPHSFSVFHTFNYEPISFLPLQTYDAVDRLTMKMCQLHYSNSGNCGFIAPGLETAMPCTWSLEKWAA